MRLWKNKTSQKEFKVTEWWEVPPGDDQIAVIEMEVDFGDGKKRKVPTKLGVLYQVGWLLESEHGVWFGLNLDAASQFEDLGPYKGKDHERKSTDVGSTVPQASGDQSASSDSNNNASRSLGSSDESTGGSQEGS